MPCVIQNARTLALCARRYNEAALFKRNRIPANVAYTRMYRCGDGQGRFLTSWQHCSSAFNGLCARSGSVGYRTLSADTSPLCLSGSITYADTRSIRKARQSARMVGSSRLRGGSRD